MRPQGVLARDLSKRGLKNTSRMHPPKRNKRARRWAIRDIAHDIQVDKELNLEDDEYYHPCDNCKGYCYDCPIYRGPGDDWSPAEP